MRASSLVIKGFLALTASLQVAALRAAPIKADLAAVKNGPISVTRQGEDLLVRWRDQESHTWAARFALESTKPLITSIQADGHVIVEKAMPWYRIHTGKRTGGWDAFFDFPPAAPEGTRTFIARFQPRTATAKTVGDRVEVSFDGVEAGIFTGSLRFTFYPGSTLVLQEAVLHTAEPDVAFTYDTGLVMSAEEDRAPGLNMASQITYYDPNDQLQTITSPYGSERHTLQVRYRAVAARMGTGSIVAFPSPHRYLFARDYTTNMGYAWYSAWRGKVGLGIQQPLDDFTAIYPWMNAPPGTAQEMGIFYMLGAGPAQATLDRVLAYTHKDHFPHVEGFTTFAPHWHFAFTEQAIAHGPAWVPPFKPALESLGVDSAMIMDFHIDGHPMDTASLRLQELEQYQKVCRSQTDSKFLLIPAEEADVYLGGHWSLTFPKPVYWMMKRAPGELFSSTDPKYGTVYRVSSAEEMWKLVETEHGYVYETHPRTKGSTGFPDKILNTNYFRSPLYFGVGWKAMPSDLSSPRLGERSFKVLDDLNNLGFHKVLVGEVDVFQTSSTDELYAHMNVNYVHLKQLPDFDHYASLLDRVAHGDEFISTGEVLLLRHVITANGAGSLAVEAHTSSTFPLRVGEVVWGDGKQTHTERFDLSTTHGYEEHTFHWNVNAPRWKWARIAVWDVAGGGAFSNPTWSIE